MAIVEFITELFCRVDDAMPDVPHHSQAALAPSERVTLGLLHALKGVDTRAFHRWRHAHHRDMFPTLPERTRLFRCLKTHAAWTDRFRAAPTLRGVVDTYRIELLHPVREGRSPAHHPLIAQFDGPRVVLGDTGFRRTEGDPPHLKLCRRGEWHDRMRIETVLSMLTTVCHVKPMRHQVWDCFQTHLGYLMALFNILVQWQGLPPDDHGVVRLSLTPVQPLNCN